MPLSGFAKREKTEIMIATLNEVMKIAEEKQIAIGSFNTPNLESLQAVIEAFYIYG